MNLLKLCKGVTWVGQGCGGGWCGGAVEEGGCHVFLLFFLFFFLVQLSLPLAVPTRQPDSHPADSRTRLDPIDFSVFTVPPQ